MAPVSIRQACDLITVRLDEAGVFLNVLKLHKLLYYVQAWHLAFYKERCFNNAFQAWVHGPVSRVIYDRYPSKGMYSPMYIGDIEKSFDPSSLDKKARRHIAAVLEKYAEFTDDQLEQMTHDEAPWQIARRGYGPRDRCEIEIDDLDMMQYYGARIAKRKAY